MAMKAYANGMKYIGLSTDTKPAQAEVGAAFLKQIRKESLSLVEKLGNLKIKRPMSG